MLIYWDVRFETVAPLKSVYRDRATCAKVLVAGTRAAREKAGAAMFRSKEMV
jgi:hypothetical protein